MRTVVVLGGYGNFGRHIVAALARRSDVYVLIAGRDATRAASLATEIGGRTSPWQVDHRAPDFGDALRSLSPFALVNTAGPFQTQDYQVARACIDAKCHYVDIADGRRFVSDIVQLDERAKASGTLVAAGVSSLPALSSAVVDRLGASFARIDGIEHGISSGARPPGVATMEGVFSYIGKPFLSWQSGAWRTVYGWQDLVAHKFPGSVGKRWIANCDVPDLELFPRRYATTRSVTFRAGVGFASTTLCMWLLSWAVRAHVIRELTFMAAPLHRAASRLERFGTEWSALYVRVRGRDSTGTSLERTWTLLAGSNHGPIVPCMPAIALTSKLLDDRLPARGAMPCMGLVGVEEILAAVPGLDIRVVEDSTPALC